MVKENAFTFETFSGRDGLEPEDRLLFEAALSIWKDAYTPYSKFNVGCAILLDSGEIITGSNQENAAYPSGLCAERTALYWAAANNSGAVFRKIFVVGGPKAELSAVPIPPCGACRQSILEYEAKQGSPIAVYFSGTAGEVVKVHSVRDLLPFSFDGKYLE